MLFRKKITRSCEYCLYGSRIQDTQVLCVKKGLRSETAGCHKFKYDPLKRIPPRRKAVDFSKYDSEDFSL
ncbi:MAG: hypothetical protein E7459_00525 [Ruminococcaceae bacterium]|nr:hypothetical protein [Oscillospiraceae bacterium]